MTSGVASSVSADSKSCQNIGQFPFEGAQFWGVNSEDPSALPKKGSSAGIAPPFSPSSDGFVEEYFLTFGAQDSNIANPWGHAWFGLSKTVRDDKGRIRLEMVNPMGFYGNPSTATDPWGRFLSGIIPADFSGNHGFIKNEPNGLREFDLGYGLHGVTFHIDKEKFDNLQAYIDKVQSDQLDAVKEAVAALSPPEGTEGCWKAEAKFRNHAYEKYGREIFKWEQDRAAKAKEKGLPNPEPRLYEFALSIGDLWTLRGSKNCKTTALEMLVKGGAITESQRKRLTENDWQPAVPLHSGPMSPVQLHMEGPLGKPYHSKSLGKPLYSRNFEHRDSDTGLATTKLYWSVPPQRLVDLEGNDHTTHRYLISPQFSKKIHKTMQNLRRLEEILINARDIKPGTTEGKKRDELVVELMDLRDQFSVIPPGFYDNNLAIAALSYSLFPKAPNPFLELLRAIDKLIKMLGELVCGPSAEYPVIKLEDCPKRPHDDAIASLLNGFKMVVPTLHDEDKYSIADILDRTFDPVIEDASEAGLASPVMA